MDDPITELIKTAKTSRQVLKSIHANKNNRIHALRKKRYELQQQSKRAIKAINNAIQMAKSGAGTINSDNDPGR